MLLRALQSGDDEAGRAAAINVEGHMKMLEEAADRSSADAKTSRRFRTMVQAMRAKLRPVLGLAAMLDERLARNAAPAEVNVSPLALEIRRRREALKRTGAAVRGEPLPQGTA